MGLVRIRLIPFPSGRPPGDLIVGRGLVDGAEPEQGLEGGHRGAATVVAEDVLVEVDGQVLVGDAAVRAVHPGLEVGDRAVRAEQQLLARRGGVLGSSAMVIAVLGQGAVGLQAVGVDDRPGLVVALAKSRSDRPEASGSTARRRRPEPAPRTSIATPTRAFLPRSRPPLRPSSR